MHRGRREDAERRGAELLGAARRADGEIAAATASRRDAEDAAAAASAAGRDSIRHATLRRNGKVGMLFLLFDFRGVVNIKNVFVHSEITSQKWIKTGIGVGDLHFHADRSRTSLNSLAHFRFL